MNYEINKSKLHLTDVGFNFIRSQPLVDVWLLTLTNEREGVWSSLKVENLESAPPRVLGQGACQVGWNLELA